MKKTSRRSFAKSMTAALAATPFASTMSGQNKQEKGTPTPYDFRSHDTPPPTDFLDGSMTVSVDKPIVYEGPSGGRHIYHKGYGVDARIAHLKVFKGNGDLLYQNLEADESVITIRFENAGLQEKGYIKIQVATVAGHAVFQIDSDKPFADTGNVLTGKRKKSYGHGGYGENFRVKSIEVNKASDPASYFIVTAPRNDSSSQEYRVMLWHIGDRLLRK